MNVAVISEKKTPEVLMDIKSNEEIDFTVIIEQKMSSKKIDNFLYFNSVVPRDDNIIDIDKQIDGNVIYGKILRENS